MIEKARSAMYRPKAIVTVEVIVLFLGEQFFFLDERFYVLFYYTSDNVFAKFRDHPQNPWSIQWIRSENVTKKRTYFRIYI